MIRTPTTRPAATDRPTANARLTAWTGLVLIVLLAAQGVTLLSIGQLVSWHIAIGVALGPPIAVKTGSTLWRIVQYYRRDPAYRRAGPPAPFFRALGPCLYVSTAAVMATGIGLWLAGPASQTLDFLHRASFFVWIAFMALHVLGRLPRATRHATADLTDRPNPGSVRLRAATVAGAVALGVLLGIATTAISTGWQGHGPGQGPGPKFPPGALHQTPPRAARGSTR